MYERPTQTFACFEIHSITSMGNLSIALYDGTVSIGGGNNYISACNVDLRDANPPKFGRDNSQRGRQNRISTEPQVKPPPNASISTS